MAQTKQVSECKILADYDVGHLAQNLNTFLYTDWELYGKLIVTAIEGKPHFSQVIVRR